MVEQLPCKEKVIGSRPVESSKEKSSLTYWKPKIVLWCNGSTPDFGSDCPGSNPGRTTIWKSNYAGA